MKQNTNFEALRCLELDCIINPTSDDLKKTVVEQSSIIRNEKWMIETRTLQKMQKVAYGKAY